MKTICFYLPQFHQIPENDSFWGKGYTEWTAVRKAKPYYDGHAQPKIPQAGYYDLLNPDTLRWQASLMSEYRIDGMCFYHYYFRGGKMLLQKPAESLLENKDINMPFFFAWDNVSWVRTWGNIKGNSWLSLPEYDKSASTDNAHRNGVLMEYDEGDKEIWTSHFEYLVDFFCDPRYMKINGHPVFMICKTKNLKCFPKMKLLWNQLADQAGIPHVHFIACNEWNQYYDSMTFREPHHTIRTIASLGKWQKTAPDIIDYDYIWAELLKKVIAIDASKVDKPIFLSGFTGYDDTPRRGDKGMVIVNASPEKFEKYMKLLYQEAERLGSEMVFVNAWNEWGEGMYLEPDNEFGDGYLKALLNARKTKL